VIETGTAVDSGPGRPDAPPEQARAQPSPAPVDRRFWAGVASAVALGAVIRFTYLFHVAPRLPLGDGLGYHLEALRIADGLGYTSPFGGTGEESAHHPPGWATLLAAVTEAGGRSVRAHQLTGLVIGLGVILVAGLVGRRYAGRRVGVVAALLAAAYPGFWVIDVQILSEPLGLLIVGVLMLELADLWQRPTIARAVLAGATTGVLALVRAEQFALFVIAVIPLVLFNPRLTVRRRLAAAGAAVLMALVPITPWTVHNLGRFEEPVFLSTNGGGLLLAGNCPPSTYSGDLNGFFGGACIFEISAGNPDFDPSQADIEARRVAFENMRENLDRLPATALARDGRMLGVFHTGQMVEFAANWFGSATWPVWAWLASFWLILPFAVGGSILLRRSRTFQWPLLAPAVLVVLIVSVSYGEPRYHTPADLGIVVLASVALDHLLRRPAADVRNVDMLLRPSSGARGAHPARALGDAPHDHIERSGEGPDHSVVPAEEPAGSRLVRPVGDRDLDRSDEGDLVP
jgi:4-amino-4-deoxy-L-arabinose transferase-like glycosyltransferase